MSDIRNEINALLDKLETDLGQINQLRKQAGVLEKSLNQLQRDYDQKLGALNTEFEQLDGRKLLLRARLERKDSPPPKPKSTGEMPTPPKEVTEPDAAAPQPSTLPPKDPRAERKRNLADHLVYFVSTEEMLEVMQVVNAVLEDARRDIGDMLELIPWGEIWIKRIEDWGETPEMQYVRLQEWDQGLTVRLTFWRGQVQRLENDPRQGLLKHMQTLSRPDWLAYLDEQVHEQAEVNTALRHEVEFLEQELAKRQ